MLPCGDTRYAGGDRYGAAGARYDRGYDRSYDRGGYDRPAYAERGGYDARRPPAYADAYERAPYPARGAYDRGGYERGAPYADRGGYGGEYPRAYERGAYDAPAACAPPCPACARSGCHGTGRAEGKRLRRAGLAMSAPPTRMATPLGTLTRGALMGASQAF